MKRAHTTEFLFDDGDYFVALTNQPVVRIGIVGGTCFDISPDHAQFDRICAAVSRDDIEACHDELTSVHM